jgi:hypothetical protein
VLSDTGPSRDSRFALEDIGNTLLSLQEHLKAAVVALSIRLLGFFKERSF